MTAESRSALSFRLLRWCATRSSADQPKDTSELSSSTLEFLRARQIDSAHYLSAQTSSGWQDAYDAVLCRQSVALEDLLKLLLEAGVRPLSFKGGELVPRYFGGHGLGFISDLDLLVPRDEIERAQSVLYAAGFRHSLFDAHTGRLRDRDLDDVARIALEHYELAPFLKPVRLPEESTLSEIARLRGRGPLVSDQTGALLLLEVDVHHNVALDVDCQPLFDRAVPRPGGVAETFSDADHVWFNLSRHYNEVALHDKISLRPIAYTLPVITAGGVDWAVVEHVARELALGPTLYYYLALCDRLAPGHIPEATLSAVAGSTTSRARDWSWQLAKLFDFRDPFPASAFNISEGLIAID